MMRLLGILILLCTVNSVLSQVDPRVADEFFKKRNYFMAIEEYKKLLKLERDNPDYNQRLAECYLYTNIDKKKALFYLQRAKKQDKYDDEVNYLLGIAHAIHYEMDEAIAALEEYLANGGKNEEAARKRLEDCKAAKKLIQSPVEVSFENMGEFINSEYPDYYPFISGDETVLSYTSRREDGKGSLEFDGYYSSDVYISKFDGKAFTSGKIMKSLNTKYNEQSTGMSLDGETMFFYSDYNPMGELFIVNKKGNDFGKKDKIDKIDDEKALESAVCISPDGQAMIYSSNIKDGKGGFDLWMVRRLPFGDNLWAEPQNMTAINTPGNEDFPSFGPDGTTIYFSSDGHPGMGGWDLYQTNWDPETNTFSTPQNLGYPLNTPDDERSISFAADGKHAYISALRDGGFGDLDIYRITYEYVEVTPALLGIKLATGDSINPFLEADMFTILDINGEIVGEYAPNSNTLEYSIILNPGTYTVEIDATEQGYDFYSKPLKVHEFMNRMGKVDMQLKLEKLE